MAFAQSWIETDPDGSVITVSQLDDWIRNTKIASRERLEGDPATPDLTGLIEVGSWPAAPKPRKGAARVYVDTDANILAFGVTKREDGRLAVASDTNKLYHVATAGVVAVVATPGTHVHSAADITSGTLIVTRGGTGVVGPTAGNLVVGAGASAMTLLAPGAAGGYVRSDGSAWVRSTISAADIVSGNLAYGHMPSGAGTWAVGGALTLTGGELKVQSGNAWNLFGSGTGTPQLGLYSGGGVNNAIFNVTADAIGTPGYLRYEFTGAQWVIGANSSDVMKVDKTATADEMGLFIWDGSAAGMKRITRGAVDSGGTGFRLLRVAN